jgi:hypothetical protein
MLFSTEAAQIVAYGIEAGIAGFVDLFWQRIEDLKALNCKPNRRAH